MPDNALTMAELEEIRARSRGTESARRASAAEEVHKLISSVQVASLPPLLLQNDSFVGFMNALKVYSWMYTSN